MHFQGGYLRGGMGASDYTGDAGRLRVQADQLDEQARQYEQNYYHWKSLYESLGKPWTEDKRQQAASYKSQMDAAYAQWQSAKKSAAALRAKADAMQSKPSAPQSAPGELPEAPSATPTTVTPAKPSLPTPGDWSSFFKPPALSTSRVSLDTTAQQAGGGKAVYWLLGIAAVGVAGVIAYMAFSGGGQKKVRQNVDSDYEDDDED